MCICKKKLLIVAGAGASVEFGMPSVNKINSLFDDWSNEILSVPLFGESLYTYLKREIENNYNSVVKPIKNQTNFEEVLFTALNLYSIKNPNKSNPISAFSDIKSIPEINAFGKLRPIDSHDFITLVQYLIDKLLIEFRNKCSDLQNTKPNEINLVNNFIDKLSDKYDVSILTFNYDNILLNALKNPVTGFDKKGKFNPNLILKENKWNFIYHLHGSVHFDMLTGSCGLHEINFNPDLNSTFQQNASGRSGDVTIEEQMVLSSSIIAGYGKSYQIQRNPYYLYFSDFGRKIYETDALLFAGYGFNDLYINNLIRESFDFNRKRPVVVLTYSQDNEDPMQFRQDNWANQLSNTISVNRFNMSTWKNTSAPEIRQVKLDKTFEVSKDVNKPLSVWHNGFLEACRNPHLIIDEFHKWK